MGEKSGLFQANSDKSPGKRDVSGASPALLMKMNGG